MKRTQGGYALLEILVYIVVLSLVANVTVNGLIIMTRSFNESRANRDLASSGASAMERLGREIRAGVSIDGAGSTFITSPGVLKLNTLDENNVAHTITFNVSGSPAQLMLTRDGSSVGALTTPHVAVESFIVRQMAVGGESAVKVELTLRAVRASGGKTANFYNTVILRGTY